MNLSQFLKTKNTILIDGAMGTQLAEAGLAMGGQNSVTHPDEVLTVHQQYAACGVDLLITKASIIHKKSKRPGRPDCASPEHAFLQS